MRTLVNMGSVASICRVDKMRTLVNKASVARKWRVDNRHTLVNMGSVASKWRVDSMCAVDKVRSVAWKCRVVCIRALCSINGKDSLRSVLGAALQRQPGGLPMVLQSGWAGWGGMGLHIALGFLP